MTKETGEKEKVSKPNKFFTSSLRTFATAAAAQEQTAQQVCSAPESTSVLTAQSLFHAVESSPSRLTGGFCSLGSGREQQQQKQAQQNEQQRPHTEDGCGWVPVHQHAPECQNQGRGACSNEPGGHRLGECVCRPADRNSSVCTPMRLSDNSCVLLLLLLLLQCFDTTMPSEARAGAHVPLNMAAKELPRWSKALTQYRCVCLCARQAAHGRCCDA